MKGFILGYLAGGLVAIGLVIAIDHLGHSDHVIGAAGSFCLGFGLAIVGGLVGAAAFRD